MSLSYEISPSQLNSYQRDGVVLLKNVFKQRWIDQISLGIDKNKETPSKYAQFLKNGPDEGAYFNDYFNWRRIPEFEELIWHSPAANVAMQLMQVDKW